MAKTASFSLPTFRILFLGACLTAGFLPIRATGETERPQMSDQISEALPDLQKFWDAKNWDGSIGLLDKLLADTPPDSYDRAMLSKYLALAYLQKGTLTEAIAPMETALKISDAHDFFEPNVTQELRLDLSKIYFEQANESKADPAAQTAAYAKARIHIERWLAIKKQIDPAVRSSPSEYTDAELFYASLLFNLAQHDTDQAGKVLKQAKNDPDQAGELRNQARQDTDEANGLFKQSLAETARGMRSTMRPSDNFYVLELANYQQLGDYESATDVLEHLVKVKPDNKSYWQQLTGFYLTLAAKASGDKDDDLAREYNTRAILAIERAQRHGALDTPTYNYNLVGLYFNVGQFDQAIHLLEAGLHNGTIEGTVQNWELLAYSYQELHQNLKAVAVFDEAAKLFPKSGQFDFLAAQILYSMNKTDAALAAIQRCVAKDGGERPWKSWTFMAYLAFELQKIDLAADAVEHAAVYPKADPAEIKRLRASVKSALQRREAQAAASAAPASK